MSIDLHNVTIELLYEHENSTSPGSRLARLDFISSTLSFIGYSNQSKDIDLVSNEIKITDTRPTDCSVFRDILQVCSYQWNKGSGIRSG